MKRSIFLGQLLGFIVTSLGGTLLHFLYDWTNQSVLIAPFSGVNESTWEHMKLLFFPMFFYALAERRFLNDRDDYWCVKLVGTLLGLVVIPVLFYTYNGAIGKSPDWINISIFFIAAAISYLAEARLMRKESLRCRRPWLSLLALCLIGVSFVAFTFAVPPLPLFRDPVTGMYGIL